jgi:hypothetical protein
LAEMPYVFWTMRWWAAALAQALHRDPVVYQSGTNEQQPEQKRVPAGQLAAGTRATRIEEGAARNRSRAARVWTSAGCLASQCHPQRRFPFIGS